MGDQRIIVFDGVCILCSRWVRFVLKHDKRREFKFAAMQSMRGRSLLTAHGIDPDDPTTFLVIDAGVAHTDTDAALLVIGRWGWMWRASANVMRLIPSSMRDAAYRWLARNRYRLFGRRDLCFLPDAGDADRFLD